MELFYREVGSGFPVVILHGLYGSSDNWVSIAKQLGLQYRIILVDQRNHGNSPHSLSHKYNDLADDLYSLVRKLEIQQFFLIGHSMGGRAAMLFQTRYPNFVKALIVVDVAPWDYSGADSWFKQSYNEHKRIIRGMMSLGLNNLKSRTEADIELSKEIADAKLRQFLFKNLRRNNHGQFYWALNLPVLEKSLEEMILGIEVDRRVVQDLNVLFIKGVNSNYIPENGIDKIYDIYPKATVVSIENSGHWVHAEQPERFLSEVLSFLSKT